MECARDRAPRWLDAGGTARTDTLESLARAFGVTLGELVDGDAASGEHPAATADEPSTQDVSLPSEIGFATLDRRDTLP